MRKTDAACLMLPGTLVMNALGQSATPRLAALFGSDRRAFLGLFAKMLLMAAGFGVAGVLSALVLGERVLSFLYKPDYVRVDLFAWLMAAAKRSGLRASPLRDVPQEVLPLCSPASSLLWQGPTSRVRSSSASAPHLPDAGRQRLRRSGQTRDLPGSDAIPLRVMWP